MTDKEDELREKIARQIETCEGSFCEHYVILKVADEILSIVEAAGYRLHPQVDVEKLTELDDDAINKILHEAGVYELKGAGRRAVTRLITAQLAHTKRQLTEQQNVA